MGAKLSTVPIPIGRYAVMRQSIGPSKAMHFTVAHETHAEAVAEAQRLYAELVAAGQMDPARLGFYVVRIVDRIGAFGGVLEAGGQER